MGAGQQYGLVVEGLDARSVRVGGDDRFMGGVCEGCLAIGGVLQETIEDSCPGVIPQRESERYILRFAPSIPRFSCCGSKTKVKGNRDVEKLPGCQDDNTKRG